MRKYRFLLWVLALLSLAITAACSTNDPSEQTNQPQGPALVMFYTDG
jgi:hypothetical protein